MYLLKLFTYLKYFDEILPRVSIKLSRPFGVSSEVIERRVSNEKLWPPENHMFQDIF